MRVVINGAGIAGCTLAYWLDRCGHDVTLFERAPAFRDGGYVIDFWGLGYDIAERMGVLPDMLRKGYAVGEVRFVGNRGQARSSLATRSFHAVTQGRFTSIARGDLARLLFDTVKDRIETHFSDGIAAIREEAGHVEVTTDGGKRLEADLVLGADGLHSRVRSLLFGSEPRYERFLGNCVAAFRVRGYRPREEDAYVTHTEPGRSISRFTMRDDETLFLLVFAAEQLEAMPEEDAGRRQALRAIFGDMGWETPAILDAMDRAEDLYFDRMSQIECPSWSRGRVALVGDAAACASLLAGEGTGLAMTEAYVLCGELARAGGDVPAALAAWESTLRGFIEGKQASARRFSSSFAPRSKAGIVLRDVVVRLMALPGLANVFIGASLRDDFVLPGYDM